MFDYPRPSAGSDTYTTKEQELLGKYKKSGLLFYKDLDAYYCTNCETVFGVECPRCGLRSARGHNAGPKDKWLFCTDRPLSTTREDGHYWTAVACSKCDYAFKVIVR